MKTMLFPAELELEGRVGGAKMWQLQNVFESKIEEGVYQSKMF